MKNTILCLGILFLMLMSSLSFAQKTSGEQKKITTPDQTHTKEKDKNLDVPEFMKNPDNKKTIERLPAHLYFKNAAFQVKANKSGIDLYEKGSSNVYAKLEQTPKEGLYRYTSSTKNGAAHFDAKGNLILKYLDNDTGKMKEIKFKSN